MRRRDSYCSLVNLPLVDPMEADQSQIPDARSPLPGNLKIDRTVMLGTVHAIEALLEKAGLKKTLIDMAKANKTLELYERALFAMTANRLCAPESKLGVWDRWLETV